MNFVIEMSISALSLILPECNKKVIVRLYIYWTMLNLVEGLLTMRLVSLISIIYLLISGCTAHSKKEHYVVVLSMDGFRSDYPLHAHSEADLYG